MVEVTGVEHVPSVIHALATASQSLLRAQSMLETSSSDSNAASSPLSGATSGAMLFLKTPMNIQALRDATGNVFKNLKCEGAAREWSTVVIVIVIFIS